MVAEAVPAPTPDHGIATGDAPKPGTLSGPQDPPPPPPLNPPKARRYHGSVQLDPTRLGRDAGVIADEVIAHLAALLGANVRLTLEIEAEIPDGAPDNVVRTITENSRTLKFQDSGFENE